jgi:HSP20 family protein
MPFVNHNSIKPFRYNTKHFFNEIEDIFDLMDPMKNNTFLERLRGTSLGGQPQTNVESYEDKCVITMAVPGISRDDIKVDVERDTLSISYEEDDSENSIFDFQPSFRKSWTVNSSIDLETINADYNNGVLIVELPKKSESGSIARRVEIK